MKKLFDLIGIYLKNFFFYFRSDFYLLFEVFVRLSDFF